MDVVESLFTWLEFNVLLGSWRPKKVLLVLIGLVFTKLVAGKNVTHLLIILGGLLLMAEYRRRQRIDKEIHKAAAVGDKLIKKMRSLKKPISMSAMSCSPMSRNGSRRGRKEATQGRLKGDNDTLVPQSSMEGQEFWYEEQVKRGILGKTSMRKRSGRLFQGNLRRGGDGDKSIWRDVEGDMEDVD